MTIKNKTSYCLHYAPSLFPVCNLLKPLTRTAEHDRGVHRVAAGPGRDFEWLESHLHRPQSNSATVETDMVSLLFV